MALSITDLKKGTIFEFEGQPYKVVDYAQKVIGRGGSIVNVRIKSLVDGKVLEKTFKGSDQLSSADVLQQTVQYLYHDDKDYYFMNEETFEQFALSSDIVGDSGNYLKEGDHVELQLFGASPIALVLAKNIPLKVTYAETAIKGDTTTAITKEATLETGFKIRVPAFIKAGDTVSVDTASGTYRGRIRV